MNLKAIVLFLLVAFGLFSSGKLAYAQWDTGQACPVAGSVPACYVAFTGYLLAAVGGLLTAAGPVRLGRAMFFLGVGIFGILAVVGTVLELIQGNVCPRAGDVPLCFVSLGMSVTILLLFLAVSRSTKAKLVDGHPSATS